MMAAYDIFEVVLKGVGGHGAYPQATKDPIVLATEMRNIVCGREAHLQDAWSLCKLIKFMLSVWQAESETNEAWKKLKAGEAAAEWVLG